MNYAEAFKSLRLAYKMTQTEFAKLLQVSKPTIQKLEAGNYPPSEMMTARLAELFRSKKFKNELRPRVESGDLQSVRDAFGDLLDKVSAESDNSESSEEIDLVDAYEDLKKIQDVVMSQQDTILNLSDTGKIIAESNNNLSMSTKNFSESSKTIAESNKTMAESNKTIAESTKNFSESHKTLAESNKNLSVSQKTFAESNKNLSVSIKNFSEGRAFKMQRR